MLTLISSEEEVVKGGEDSISGLPKKMKVDYWLLVGILFLKKVAYMGMVCIFMYFIVCVL